MVLGKQIYNLHPEGYENKYPLIVKQLKNSNIYFLKTTARGVMTHEIRDYIIIGGDEEINFQASDSGFFGGGYPKEQIEPKAWLFYDKYVFVQYQTVSVDYRQNEDENDVVHTSLALDLYDIDSCVWVSLNDLINKENILKFDISNNKIIIKANNDVSDDENKYDEVKYETKEIDLKELLEKL